MHYRTVDFFLWCENTWFARWIKGARWVFPVTETVHIIGLAVLLGTILVVDLRLLGWGMRRQSPEELAKDLAPWTLGGLLVMVCTGVPMFMSEAVRLYSSAPFFYKMGLLALALLTHFTIHRKATRAGGTEGSWRGKLTACFSLFCWLGVAFAGRVIAFTGDRFR